MMKINSFDQIFDLIRPYGWYQLLILFTVQYTCINVAGNFFFMTFAGMKPSLYCRDEKIPDTYCIDDSNLLLLKISAASKIVAANCSTRDQVEIRSQFKSIYEENQDDRGFDFSCHANDFVPGLITTLQMIAAGLGEVIGGHLADYFGRKYMIYGGYSLMTLLGLLTGLSPTWQCMAVTVIGMGLCHGVQMASFFGLVSETVGKRYRIMQSCAFQWSLAFQVVALTAWLTGEWRKYIIIINAICLPVLALLLFIVKESPRWLIQQKRPDEAVAVLNWMARLNGRREIQFSPENLENLVIDATMDSGSSGGGGSAKSAKIMENGAKNRCTMWDLVRRRPLRLYSLALSVTAISCECIPGVFMFNVQSLAGSPFLNVSLYGLLRLWTPVFLVLLEQKTRRIGRRASFIISQGSVSFCFLAIIAIFLLGRFDQLKLLATLLAQFGAVVNVGMSWVIYKQYITELYPTVMRGIALGTFSVVAVLGMAIAPQLVYLGKFWPGTPYAGAALISTLSLCLGWLILPETSGQPLPDVLVEAVKREGHRQQAMSSNPVGNDNNDDEEMKMLNFLP